MKSRSEDSRLSNSKVSVANGEGRASKGKRKIKLGESRDKIIQSGRLRILL